jgi:predicted DNA-binding protein with PD1-like motif
MNKSIGIKGELLNLKVDYGRDLRKEIELHCKGRYVKLATVFNAFGTLAKVRLGLSKNTTPLELNDPVELLSSSGIVREENGQLDTNVNIIVSDYGKLYAGKLLYGCVTSKPEGVNVLFSVIVKGL